jgi:hypothetical protein
MEILLVYMMVHINDPTREIGPQVSDRIFESTEECKDFVNTLAGSDAFTGTRFKFIANDGVVFHGGCMTPFEYELYRKGLTKAPRNA